MQTTWLRRGESDRLKIYVLGWAADPSMTPTAEPDFDIVCTYDYRTIEPLQIDGNYRQIHLVAWSYGVWVAEQIVQGVELTSAVAINGTPYPLSAQWGIHPRIFARSLPNIDVKLFARRMCTGMERVVEIKRDEHECREELRALAEHFAKEYKPHIEWSEAIVGGKDLIYPPESQLRYWQNCKVGIDYREDMPHYLFY